MLSIRMMIALCVVYAVIAVASACERNWWRALYYVGAIVISVAVMGMTE